MTQEDRNNQQQILSIIKAYDQSLYELFLMIHRFKTNPFVLERIAFQAHKIAENTKYGRVVVYIADNKITQIEGTHFEKIDTNLLTNRNQKEAVISPT